MKTYGGMKVKLHAFVTSVLGGGEWCYASAALTSVIHWIGVWVGPIVGLDAAGMRDILLTILFQEDCCLLGCSTANRPDDGGSKDL
jgi:hypothetical protein